MRDGAFDPTLLDGPRRQQVLGAEEEFVRQVAIYPKPLMERRITQQQIDLCTDTFSRIGGNNRPPSTSR